MVTFEILEEWTKRREKFIPGLKGLNTQRDDDIQEEKKCSEPIHNIRKVLRTP